MEIGKLAAAALAVVGAVGCQVLAPSDAMAKDGASEAERPAIWLITLGAYAVVSPDFEGSSSYGVGGRPIFGIRRAGSREWLALPNDGIDIEVFETDRFRAGPVAALRFNRDTDRTVRGFERVGGKDGIDIAVEAGVFAELWPHNSWRTRVELREGVVGAGGLVADFSTDLVWRPGPWTFATGPRLTIADERYVEARFAVAPHQVTPTLPLHQTSAGVTSVGFGFTAIYDWNERWRSRAYVEYERLVGDAGSSPLVESQDQVRFGIGTSVTFGVGR
jgi:outer membrane scaffolding protein for murein synthesis (MipA/OmpV family)